MQVRHHPAADRVRLPDGESFTTQYGAAVLRHMSQGSIVWSYSIPNFMLFSFGYDCGPRRR